MILTGWTVILPTGQLTPALIWPMGSWCGGQGHMKDGDALRKIANRNSLGLLIDGLLTFELTWVNLLSIMWQWITRGESLVCPWHRRTLWHKIIVQCFCQNKTIWCIFQTFSADMISQYESYCITFKLKKKYINWIYVVTCHDHLFHHCSLLLCCWFQEWKLPHKCKVFIA